MQFGPERAEEEIPPLSGGRAECSWEDQSMREDARQVMQSTGLKKPSNIYKSEVGAVDSFCYLTISFLYM